MVGALIAVVLIAPGGLPAGPGRIEVALGDRAIEVYTYKPDAYDGGPMLMVFHGVLRNADEYRDHARGMGDRFRALVVAPKFDAERFPSSKYNQGGLLRRDRSVAPRADWTWSLIPKLADEIRRREGRPDLPYYLIGHSAGGQFVGRMAAFVETGARGMVAANPSSWVFPSRAMDYPYGFGGLPEEFSDEAHLRRYLGQPLTLYLGTADTERDKDLDKSPEADRQGESRLRRGHNAFDAARRLAGRNGWDFGWRLVEAPGVAHDHQAMFDSPACEAALFGPRRDSGSPP